MPKKKVDPVVAERESRRLAMKSRLQLLRDLKAAKEPSRDLDARIQICMHIVRQSRPGIITYGAFKNESDWVAAAVKNRWGIPFYTSHLDSAKLLMINQDLTTWAVGSDFNIDGKVKPRNYYASVSYRETTGHDLIIYHGDATSRVDAIALTLALLRMRDWASRSPNAAR